METFRFKKFSVSHRHSFKVGTDAVLLGALTPVCGCAENLASRHCNRFNASHCEQSDSLHVTHYTLRERVWRHCERSEAIQRNNAVIPAKAGIPENKSESKEIAGQARNDGLGYHDHWIASGYRPRNDVAADFSHGLVNAETKRVLDIGCGSGIIALMLLQRGVSSAVGIEIDPLAAVEAAENARKSVWNDRMQIVFGDFCDLSAVRPLGFFDLIVSNPPFFSKSLKSPDSKRNATRHNDETLPFERLIQNAAAVLSDNGLFSLILPVPEAELFMQKAASCHLFPVEIHHIFSKPHKPESRQILVLKKQSSPQPFVEKSLCIYQADGSYSEEYKALTTEFYLNF